MFGNLLIDTNISLRVMDGQVRPDTTQQYRNSLVANRVTVVEVGKNREMAAMLFEWLERLGHFIGSARLVRGGEKRLLVNPVVIRQADEPLDRFGSCSAARRGHRFEHR